MLFNYRFLISGLLIMTEYSFEYKILESLIFIMLLEILFYFKFAS